MEEVFPMTNTEVNQNN